jgi:hypothetical protein
VGAALLFMFVHLYLFLVAVEESLADLLAAVLPFA